MKFSLKQAGKVALSFALLSTAVTSGVSLSTAAALPSIRLTSPVYTSANSVDATGDIAQYYSPGTKAFYTYIKAGSTLTLTYHVSTDGSTAAKNQQVLLQVNAPYSGSAALWSADGKAIPAQQNDGYGAQLTGTTNDSGDVTFTIVSTSTTGLEGVPTSLTMNRDKITPARLYGTMKPILPGVGDKAEDTDIATFDVASDLPSLVAPTPTASATPKPVATPTPTSTPSASEAPVVLKDQSVASFAAKIKIGKVLALPAKSNSGIVIIWISDSKNCVVKGSKLTAKKIGSCNVIGTNAGDMKYNSFSVMKKVSVTK
ncbi:MAG: hypothetical protein WCO08_06770 [Actinomycetes bacterium]